MVPDDHDVSDDWYFSREWREQVFTRPLGVDIVRNGMMAIALMQAWGNNPRRWSTGPELELIDRITGFAPAMAATAGQPGTFPRASLDRLHELLGLPQSVNTGVAPTFRPLVEFSFQVEGPRSSRAGDRRPNQTALSVSHVASRRHRLRRCNRPDQRRAADRPSRRGGDRPLR